MHLHTILQPWGAGVRFLEVVVALAIKEFEQRHPELTSWERWKINSLTHIYLFMKVSHIVLPVLGYARKRWLNMLYWIVWETKYGHFTMLNIPKCEHLTVLVCPLWFLVISAMRQLGNVQSFKTYMFLLLSFLPWTQPQLGRGCKRDQDEIRNYMDRGGLHHLGRLPHLPGVPHLHVNRP